MDACGINAQCKALNHGAICSCPGKKKQIEKKEKLGKINDFETFFSDGYVGDALTACREQRNRQSNVQNTRVIGLSRYRRDLNEYFSSFFF